MVSSLASYVAAVAAGLALLPDGIHVAAASLGSVAAPVPFVNPASNILNEAKHGVKTEGILTAAPAPAGLTDAQERVVRDTMGPKAVAFVKQTLANSNSLKLTPGGAGDTGPGTEETKMKEIEDTHPELKTFLQAKLEKNFIEAVNALQQQGKLNSLSEEARDAELVKVAEREAKTLARTDLRISEERVKYLESGLKKIEDRTMEQAGAKADTDAEEIRKEVIRGLGGDKARSVMATVGYGVWESIKMMVILLLVVIANPGSM